MIEETFDNNIDVNISGGLQLARVEYIIFIFFDSKIAYIDDTILQISLTLDHVFYKAVTICKDLS